MPRGRGPRRNTPEGGLRPAQTAEEIQGAILDAHEDIEELDRLADLTELEWVYALLTGKAEKRRNEVTNYQRRLRKMGG
jgi:hypothetical protein